jgi:hypothetical protein
MLVVSVSESAEKEDSEEDDVKGEGEDSDDNELIDMDEDEDDNGDSDDGDADSDEGWSSKLASDSESPSLLSSPDKSTIEWHKNSLTFWRCRCTRIRVARCVASNTRSRSTPRGMHR